MRPTRVFPIILATCRCLHCSVPPTMRRHVVYTHLRVVLTRSRMDLMLLRVHLTCRHVYLELLPEAPPPTSFHPVLCYCRCSVDFFTAFFIFYFYFPCIVFFIYFSFMLLFVLFFVGFYLLALMWFDFEEEIDSIWLFTVPALQLSFYSDSCFTCIGLFIEFICNLHRLVWSWNRAGLLMVLFELLVNTIASYSVLLGPDPVFVLIFALLFII
jgi:hypothetical protein